MKECYLSGSQTFLHILGSKIEVIKQLVLTLLFETVPRALNVYKSRKTQ